MKRRTVTTTTYPDGSLVMEVITSPDPAGAVDKAIKADRVLEDMFQEKARVSLAA